MTTTASSAARNTSPADSGSGLTEAAMIAGTLPPGLRCNGMARTTSLIPLGYGKFVRADRVYALVPLEGAARGDGRRTLVYVEGIEDPIIASRSEGAIARDV